MDNTFWCNKYNYNFPIQSIALRGDCGNKNIPSSYSGWRMYNVETRKNWNNIARKFDLEIIQINKILYVRDRKN